ncbi:MAG: CBS domain-containing protein [Paracoccaceae bacterium]
MSTTTIRDLLGGREVRHVAPGASLKEAAGLMAAHGVGALAVTEGDVLKGILSERDIVFRAVARDRDLGTTSVAEVMTVDPVVVDIEDAISDALVARLGESFRHLPVIEAGRVVGLLSYRDIPAKYVMMYEHFREMAGARADQAG